MSDRVRGQSPAEARQAFRAILTRSGCVRPASVFDPLSARMAAAMGFPLAMLGGSVAAMAVLGAPDHNLLTLDEFAGLCRRICRAGALPLMVDADHGFGNALNAMRCVEELELAGVAAISLEDTDLPADHGALQPRLIAEDAAAAKIAAAVAARRDPALAIVARTDARLQDVAGLARRAALFAGAGADCLMLAGLRRLDQVAAIRAACDLPLVLAGQNGEMAGQDLGALGVRICLQGHRTFPAAMAGAWNSLATEAQPLAAGWEAGNLADLTLEADYARLIRDYLGGAE